MNKLPLIDFSKDVIRNKAGDFKLAVDMTCGNGNDTIFLAGIFERVQGFDVQEVAVENTLKLLEENDIKNVDIHLDSFVNVDKYVEAADAFVYNLGYLPKGDKSVVTRMDDSLASLKKVTGLLKKDGVISIMTYLGHEEGSREHKSIESFVSNLNNKDFEVLKFEPVNKIKPPVLFLIIKKV